MTTPSPSSVREPCPQCAGESFSRTDLLGDGSISPNPELRSLVRQLQQSRIDLELKSQALRACQDDLARIRDRYVGLFEYSPVGFLSMDADTVICEVNRLTEILLGSSRAELKGKRLADLVIPESLQTIYYHLRDACFGETARGCELGLMRGDGTVALIQLEIAWAADIPDTVPFYRCAMHEISDRKLAELERRLQLEKLSGHNPQQERLEVAGFGQATETAQIKMQVNEPTGILGREPPSG